MELNLLLDYQPGEAGEGYVQIKATANGLAVLMPISVSMSWTLPRKR